jgi:septal ring factor EnvC (AmiA/AmiB activator)
VDPEAAVEADIAKLEKTVAFLSGVENARKEDLTVETQRLEQSRKVMEEACSILEENVQYLSGRERELLARIRSIEDEVDSLRRKRIAEMESVIASQKEAALNKVAAWTAEEQSRLAEQLNLEYANRTAVNGGAILGH